MLFADDVGVASKAPEKSWKVLVVAVQVSAAFFEPFIMQGYSELTRGVPNTTTTFSVEEVSTVHTKISQPGISWRNVIHDTDLSISLDSRICNAWGSFSKYDYKIYCLS